MSTSFLNADLSLIPLATYIEFPFYLRFTFPPSSTFASYSQLSYIFINLTFVGHLYDFSSDSSFDSLSKSSFYSSFNSLSDSSSDFYTKSLSDSSTNSLSDSWEFNLTPRPSPTGSYLKIFEDLHMMLNMYFLWTSDSFQIFLLLGFFYLKTKFYWPSWKFIFNFLTVLLTKNVLFLIGPSNVPPIFSS